MIRELVQFHRFASRHPVGKRDVVSVWRRWLNWQLSSRLGRSPVTVSWIREAVLVAEPGMTGLTGNIYCGLHEFEEMALLLHFFDPSPGVFLDVGSNAGSWTILASKVCGCRSIAVEPVPATYAKLQRNLIANGIESHVDAHCIALGAVKGSLRFSADRDTMNQVVAEDYSGAVITVPVQTMDELTTSVRPDFIKIDVEGFESEVLAGACETLGDPQLSVVLLESDSDAIQEVMKSLGFVLTSYSPVDRKLKFGDSKELGAAANHLWVRKPEVVEARCRQAAVFDILGYRI